MHFVLVILLYCCTVLHCTVTYLEHFPSQIFSTRSSTLVGIIIRNALNMPLYKKGKQRGAKQREAKQREERGKTELKNSNQAKIEIFNNHNVFFFAV